MKTKKKVKHIKFDFFNIMMGITAIAASCLLIHDFIFWGVIPMFTGTFYQLTYFGLFLDLFAIAMLEMSIQFIKEWF